ncbi:MAG: MurR/RpiR family transcriptional regulator [Erysipelotrichaceae bacterium]|nr:MurR/RpiR family transcriptional regulator [Erysipelotrichaceae bacterium]MDY5252616.1 MurR/RpiR family transcriptional regulator [Erysipelotrichaceae bacterium]
MSCIYKVKEAFDNFTATEKAIAEYILEHRNETIEKSAQELGMITKTSAAAWIRFAQKLGYKGLTAMKVDIAKDSQDEAELFNEIIEENDTLSTMVRKVYQMSLQHIDKTYKLLNNENLQTAIDHLLQAKRIFLVGIGGSGIVCTDLMHKLTRLDKEVIYHEDPHILLARIAHIQPEDVMIAISYSGETKIVNASVEYAQKQHAFTIAITQYNIRSTLANLADIKLYTPVVEKELRLGAIASRNSALSLSDLLYYGVAKNDFAKTKEDLIKTRHLIDEMDTM